MCGWCSSVGRLFIVVAGMTSDGRDEHRLAPVESALFAARAAHKRATRALITAWVDHAHLLESVLYENRSLLHNCTDIFTIFSISNHRAEYVERVIASVAPIVPPDALRCGDEWTVGCTTGMIHSGRHHQIHQIHQSLETFQRQLHQLQRQLHHLQ